MARHIQHQAGIQEDGFRRMDHSAGLTFSQVGGLVQITLSLHVPISASVREDNNTALISPNNWKSLYHC